MAKHSPWLAIQAEHEQDLEHAIKWWKESSEQVKIKIWHAIQDTGGDPVREIIARFAQVGFEEIALKVENKQDELD